MTPFSKVMFLGSKRLGLRCLEEMHRISRDTLVAMMTIDDRDDTRSVFGDMRVFAAQNQIPLFIAKNRKDSEKIIMAQKPELCIVNGWYWLIGDDALRSVPGGFLGMHNSLLPKYRGGSPLVWAMINGEKKTGLSLFSFTSGMDEGDIWAQEAVPIGEGDYIGDVLLKIENKAVEVIRKKYLSILTGKLKPAPQSPDGATYCALRLPEDGVIDWSQPARSLYNFIRAQAEPYPGAFTYLKGKTLIIWRARMLDAIYFGRPGQVARIAGDEVYVICGDNRPLLLQEVGLADSARRIASSIVKSIKTRFE